MSLAFVDCDLFDIVGISLLIVLQKSNIFHDHSVMCKSALTRDVGVLCAKFRKQPNALKETEEK